MNISDVIIIFALAPFFFSFVKGYINLCCVRVVSSLSSLLIIWTFYALSYYLPMDHGGNAGPSMLYFSFSMSKVPRR